MNSNIFLLMTLLSQCASLPNCMITTCNSYDTATNYCFTITTSNSTSYLNFYGSIRKNKFIYCPTQNTWCNDFVNFNNLTAACQPLLANGQACISGYECISGICVNAVCASIQGSVNFKCAINPDCEYGLSCISGKCTKPKTIGSICSSPTLYGNYGLSMDNNECDYTQNLICGYGYTSGSVNTNSTCMKLFSITSSNTFVSNPLLCKTMVTSSTTQNGFAPGYCIADRAQYLYALQYDPGTSAKICASDSDCQYSLNKSTTTSLSGSCNCVLWAKQPQSLCNYGGGEADVISDMQYFQTNWVPLYGMMYNLHAFKYFYYLDNYMRTTMVNPAYCSFSSFYKNLTITKQSTSSVLIFYIVVGALFGIGFVGLLIVFFMC